MGIFTPEQQRIINVLLEAHITWRRLFNAHGARIRAIQEILFQKGVTTAQELEQISKEVAAMAAVEQAVGPHPEALEEKLRRLMQGEALEEA